MSNASERNFEDFQWKCIVPGVYYQLLPWLHLETCINASFTCIRLKSSANGRNAVGHATTPNITGSCCVRLHVAKSLALFFKFFATIPNNTQKQQGVQTNATCYIQQCCELVQRCVRLHGALPLNSLQQVIVQFINFSIQTQKRNIYQLFLEPEGLGVNSQWGRKSNGLLTQRPWGRGE